MKLTFKDLKQEKFTLDAEPTETVGEVKEKLAKSKGWEKNLIKLIYSGKVLQDTQTVEASKYEEKGFIVCMVSKPPKPAAAAVPATPSAQISSTPAAVPPTPQPQSSTPSAPVPPATPTPAGPTEQAGSMGGSSAFASNGAEREAAIANMQSMGFERSQIDAAMQAAFWNPDRAVEYLLMGIPENLQRPARPAAASTPAPPTTAPVAQTNTTNPPPVADATHDPSAQETGGDDDEGINLFDAAANARATGGRAAPTGAGETGGLAGAQGQGMNLDFLRNNPQFQQLRSLIQSQPGYLEQILQSVAAGNPALAQMIGQNPEQFLQLLSEDDGEDAPLPPGMQQVSVTEEESLAIDRLCTLGFHRDVVIQAYFACEKNEELAANFLFDQGDDFEQPPPQ